MNKIISVDKPAGWTSFDVVAKLRGEFEKKITGDLTFCGCDACLQERRRREEQPESKPKRPHRVKVGHSGTLDPFATGLLIIAVGKATKRIDEYMGLPKTYEATIKLGVVTDTLDPEGEEQFVSDTKPSQEEVEQALKHFRGQIEQIPPKFSALKVNGKRAYKLAREGKEVKLEPRKVTIHSLDLLNYNYPELNIRTEVSKGTYIRTLAQDIGNKLGTGGYCTGLRRSQIGEHHVSGAINVSDFKP